MLRFMLCFGTLAYTVQSSANSAYSYIVEEKDEYGIGRVWVGSSNQCVLQGLDTLSSHIYRLTYQTGNGPVTSKWINVLTTREPITSDYITRACRSTGSSNCT